MGAYDNVTVVEITAGRHGVWGIRNSHRVPLGGLAGLRNATLEDGTWRTGAGATKLGVAIGQSVMAAYDYFPDVVTQHLLAAGADGKLYKDDAGGAGWVAAASGLGVTNSVPHFSVGGNEAVGRARRAFFADRVNVPQVMVGNAAAFTAISNPHSDWAGLNQPGFFALGQGYNWAGGNLNNQHLIYRSKIGDHEDFKTDPRVWILGPDQNEDRVVGGLFYKVGMVFFKYPEGVYFMDMRDPDDTQWHPQRVAIPGAAGPRCFVPWEDDVLWISPDGSWHSLNATQATGSFRASDFSYKKLGQFAKEQINLALLEQADVVYYSDLRKVILSHAAIGQTTKNRRLELDLTQREEVGDNWLTWDRDRNETLLMRRKPGGGGRSVPVIADETGQFWSLDARDRSKNGAGYRFEWFLRDTDFGQLLQGFSGRPKNLVFLQLIFDPVSKATHTVELWIDGRKRQTITFTLGGGGIVLDDPLRAVLQPFSPGTATFGSSTLRPTPRRRLKGQAVSLALRGYSTGNREDVAIAKILIGLKRAS